MKLLAFYLSAFSLGFGMSCADISDEGEMSAFGLPGLTGVLVLAVPGNCALAKSGLQNI